MLLWFELLSVSVASNELNLSSSFRSCVCLLATSHAVCLFVYLFWHFTLSICLRPSFSPFLFESAFLPLSLFCPSLSLFVCLPFWYYTFISNVSGDSRTPATKVTSTLRGLWRDKPRLSSSRTRQKKFPSQARTHERRGPKTLLAKREIIVHKQNGNNKHSAALHRVSSTSN